MEALLLQDELGDAMEERRQALARLPAGPSSERSRLVGMRTRLARRAFTLGARADQIAGNGQYTEAESLLRQALAAQRELQPSRPWLAADTQSRLGGVLLAQRRFSEAEPLLVQGFEGFIGDPPNFDERNTMMALRRGALDRIVRLYEETNRPDRAAVWREKRDAESQPQ